MKKLLLWLLGIIIGLLLLLYILLFSPIGNAIFKPIIQSQINAHSPVPLKLDTFSLGLTSTHIVLSNGEKLTIDLSGGYNLFTLNVDLALLVDANDISLFGDMVGVELAGSFEARAKAQGKVFETLNINLTSDIAKSKTALALTLENLTPTAIIADISALRIDEALAMGGVKPYVSGILGLKANIKGDTNAQSKANALSGQANLAITQGVFSQALIQKDFDITIPRTSFTANANAIFDTDKIKHNLAFNANVGKILSSGTTQIAPLLTKSTYSVSLSDISAFTPLLGTKVRGALRSSGEVVGGMESMKITGASDIAESSTTYTALLESLAPQRVAFDTKGLKIERILYMLYLPQFITGVENASGEIWDFDKGISAQVTSSLKGLVQGAVVQKELGLAMPNTPFSYKSNARLQKGVGEADFTLDSSLAEMVLNPIKINTSSSAISTPYIIKIPNLKALKFLTGVELAGSFEASGRAKISDTIQADFQTTSLGGKIDASLQGDEFRAKLDDIDTIALLKMLQYPQVFSAKANGELNYNLTKESGNLRAVLSHGHFMKTDLTNAIQRHTNTDITGLLFEGVGVDSAIEKLKLTSKFGAKSGDFSMMGENILIDLERSTINAKLKTAIKGDSVDVNINGAINAPKVDIDFSALAKKKAEQALKNELNKQIDKHKDPALDMLKGIFK